MKKLKRIPIIWRIGIILIVGGFLSLAIWGDPQIALLLFLLGGVMTVRVIF